MDTFMEIVGNITKLSSVPLMILLVGGGIFLTFKLGFFQFRYFPHIMKSTFGKMFKKSEGEGTITAFQALAGSLASTVGAANIVGVPVAIALGGPGAIFWMWMVALIGMATKYSEVVLGMMYRTKNKRGEYVGGPMYYIDKGLGWKWMAILFACVQLLVVFGSTSAQANSLAGAISGSFEVPGIITGIVVSVLIALVMFGGLKSIGNFAEKVIPIMVVLYIVASLIVLIVNITVIPEAFALIFKYAFTPISAAGGFAGAAIAAAIRNGVARGLYSNEAGMGSAAIFHAGAKIKHPAKQGFWGVFEVFVDTIIISTITALVILTTDVWQVIEVNEAAGMTAAAMSSVFGSDLAGIIITVAIFFFAFTTILMVVYAGEKQAEYLFGYNASVIFRYIFIGAILFGSMSSLILIWSLLDILLALIVIPNMIAVILLSGKVKEITTDYFTNHYKKKTNLD
ncbi:alanine/glycine:cation symporter family protein [Salipaludibacillus sp. CF4.18]|uniref:alanine/glycine:cation symporter family protein n=1 Tax=Salipaludibacillus sp. CF4.18 TaxID=3373081 RepID=UPI003EE75C4B